MWHIDASDWDGTLAAWYEAVAGEWSEHCIDGVHDACEGCERCPCHGDVVCVRGEFRPVETIVIKDGLV